MGVTNVDHIWKSLGPLGRYQFKQLATYYLSFITWAFQALTFVFIGYRPPNYHCKPLNDTLMSNNTGIDNDYKQCNIIHYTNTSNGSQEVSVPCDVWDYGSPADRSFITEWDLVCQYADLGELTQVLYLVGVMIGTMFFPTLSDRFGRKPVMVISNVICFVISLATAFSGIYGIFVVLRLLAGVFSAGVLAGTPLAIETLPKDIRHYYSVWALLAWTTVIAFMAPIAYALRNYPWEYLQMTYALCSVWSIIEWWMIDESLCWLVANDKIVQAKEVIKNACKWNKKNYVDIMEEIGWGHLVDREVEPLTKPDASEQHNENDKRMEEKLINSLEETKTNLNTNNIAGKNARMNDPTADHENGDAKDEDSVKEKLMGQKSEIEDVIHDKQKENDRKGANEKHEVFVKYTILDIFKHKRVLIVSIILWCIWISDSFVYYGLYLSSPNLYGDRYINFFLIAIVEYPSAFIQYFTLARIGRKWTAVIGHFIAVIGLAIGTALTFTAGENKGMLAASTVFILIGKTGTTIGLNTLYVMTPELYPTNMRNIGYGVCTFMEKVGAMIAPFSRNMSGQIQWLPPCVFAIMSILTVILFAFIPETNGVELPQTMEELRDWYHVNRFELKVGKNRARKDKEKETRL